MNSKGFSLLELIIAMLILSLVTAGSFSLYITSQKFLVEEKERLVRLHEGLSELEILERQIGADFDIVNE